MRTDGLWLFTAVLLGCSVPGASAVNSPIGSSDSPDAGDGDDDESDEDDDEDDEGVQPVCSAACKDFPATALVVDSDPPIGEDDIAHFADPNELGASELCVLEPELSRGDRPGAMFPVNWLRPRFRWQGDAELYEVRLHSEVELNDLRAYTRQPEWTLPRDIWEAAAQNLRSVEVTIRAFRAGRLSGTRGSFLIAPVEAGGSLVFWATTSSEVTESSSKLHGFRVGDEAVIETLRASEVQTTPVLHENGRDLRGEFGGAKPGFQPGDVQCIGCHEGTPDGEAVVFTDDYPWSKVVSSVKADESGTTPSYVSPGAETLLKQPWLGTQTMSAAHWEAGDRILIASYAERTVPFSTTSGQNDVLVWFDLETDADVPGEVPEVSASMPPTRDELMMMRNAAITRARGSAWDTLTLEGETGNAVTPSFSHDGSRIAYVSTDRSPNGHPAYEASVADVHVVPYADRAGGQVSSLSGAAAPDWLEYYPSFSSDDAFIAFTRAPRPGASPDGPYYNRNGEIFVVPSQGGEPVRLAANDPPSCGGEHSPGVLNSWPKWSPKMRSEAGKAYYFLIFSSARAYPGSFDIPRSPYTPPTLDTRSSQLYMAAIVVDEASGELTTYPAVYLWNQNRLQVDGELDAVSTSNLTPAWAEFDIPPVVLL
jgi:hypothetical protein